MRGFFLLLFVVFVNLFIGQDFKLIQDDFIKVIKNNAINTENNNKF